MFTLPPPPGVPPGSMLHSPAPAAKTAPKPSPVQPPEADFDRSIDYYADYSGCGHWRMIWPGHLLNAHNKAVIHGKTMMVLDERYYHNTKSVRVQRQATDTQRRFIRLLREYSNKLNNFHIIYEIDDIVFSEDIPDYKSLTIETRLNGEVMQNAKLSQLIFDIPILISYVSKAMAWRAGDVLVTGTPGGVGFKRNPPVFMKPGDNVEVEISDIGVLSNTIKDEIISN